MPSAPSTSKRVKGVQIYRPIVYGNIATPITKENRTSNLPPEHTHRWTVCVKGVYDEDISYFIKRVQFKLHETYTNATRTLDSPPFEVSETGWGEFDIHIKIFFRTESGEKPLQLYHHLSLHPYGPDKEIAKEQGRPVHAYQYEEILFNEPTEAMYDILTSNKGPEIAPKRTGKIMYALDTEGEEEDRLAEAIKQVQEIKEETRSKLIEKEKALAEMKAASGKYPPKT
ncbi:NuA4 histone H4 acetyltransferase complex and the SWR1 complex subunit [Orbilia brochopaga]|uniref:Protein AF-9 homolog n=1 Tax=Orbilia brochopaga TaxID=3140254 RepID=A0AAV9UFC2_9PEZI